jgi:hypothetical protein
MNGSPVDGKHHVPATGGFLTAGKITVTTGGKMADAGKNTGNMSVSTNMITSIGMGDRLSRLAKIFDVKSVASP